MTLSKSNRKPPYKDDEFLKLVGKRLDDLLKQNGLTHENFYHDTEINPHRYIAGKVNMTVSNLKRICDYFKITPEEFFRGLRSN